jgi:predicted NUDIX family phosphoesterase
MSEEVMVVATEELRPFFNATLIRDRADELLELIADRHTFIDRDLAERSPEWRQIIPYVVIRHGDETFALTRTTKQTEARLHRKLSLGVGGHVNPGHSLLEGLQKELDEEVHIGTDYAMEFVGIINDDSTDVGRVHLGVVYVLRSSDRNVRVKETEKMTGEWLPRRDLAPLRDAMESWSQIVYDALLT